MTHPTTPPLWLLIDGQNIVHRDAHAFGVARASATFARRLDYLGQKFAPEAIITAWDTDAPTFRHRLYPDYKSGRKRLDAIGAAKDECLRRCIPCIESPGFEADDILATLTAEAKADGRRVVIYSSDRDLHQLIAAGEVTQLARVTRDKASIHCLWVTEAALRSKYGIGPAQFVDLKCLIGDPSDNIPGVDRIGMITARNILQACGTLDAFFDRPFAAPLSPAQRAAVVRARPNIPMARQLATLRADVPLPQLWREGV